MIFFFMFVQLDKVGEILLAQLAFVADHIVKVLQFVSHSEMLHYDVLVDVSSAFLTLKVGRTLDRDMLDKVLTGLAVINVSDCCWWNRLLLAMLQMVPHALENPIAVGTNVTVRPGQQTAFASKGNLVTIVTLLAHQLHDS